jgi:hypothetical protein
VASFDKAIPPGQEGTIRFKVKTSHLRGKVKRSVTVSSNDPENPKTILLISLDSVGSVNILPSYRIVLNDRNDTYRRSKLLLRKDATETGTLTVRDVTVSSPMLVAEARPATETESFHPRRIQVEPGDWVLDVRLEGEPDPGLHRQSVKFKTGLSREPEITVPVTVSIRSFVNVSRRKLVLEEPSQGTPVRGELTARLRKGVDPERLQVAVSPKAFRLSTERMEGGDLRLEVVLEPQGPKFPYRGIIQFRHGSKTFEVPIQVKRSRPFPGQRRPAAGS